jgi:hypothetical protein
MDIFILILVSMGFGFWRGYRAGQHSGRMDAYRRVSDTMKRS